VARWRNPIVVVVLTLLGGCASVHRVGRPPSVDEIDRINGSASGDPGSFTVHYIDPSNPCEHRTCSPEVRPISDTPPLEIARIASADAQQLSVVARSGEAWRLDLSRVAGVSTYHRGTLAGGLAGGGIGLGFGALFAFAYSYRGPDTYADSYPQTHATSVWTPIGIAAVFTGLGAIIGAVVGHFALARDSFEFGDSGLSSEPSSEFGR
jgi:hypothetical protein